MSDDKRRDEEQEERPKIQIVDRRMLSEDERAGKATTTEPAGESQSSEGERPHLEMIGGGTPKEDAPASAPRVTLDAEAVEHVHGPDCDHDHDHDHGDEGEPMTEAEQAEMRAHLEQEQFQAIEQQMGRPLTEQEKDAVRAEMERQAQAVTSLEVAPLLIEMLNTMPRYALVHLGLMPNPYTRLVARNDAQARLAIDSYEAVFNLLKPHLDPNSQKECTRILNDLKVNFVSITGSQITGGGGGGPKIIH
jgi:hypothetical protein